MTSARFDRDTARALTWLSAAYFIQATSAMAIVGAFDAIAGEWRLNPTQVALLVSAFGFTFALLAPVLQMIIGHWVRRTQVLVGLTTLAVGAFGSALAPNYAVLLASRVVMGLGATLIGPVLAALGSAMVGPARQGAALAVVLMGLSVASVVGVPASAWLSHSLGPRGLFLLLALAALLVAWAIRRAVHDRHRGERVNPATLLALLRRPATASGLLVILFATSGLFATYTMIGPLLADRWGFAPAGIGRALFLFGLAGVSGNLFVRSASVRWSSERILGVSLAALGAIFLALDLLPTATAVVYAGLMLWAFAADLLWPSQQRRMVELEPTYRGLALALTASFMFTGIAAGSALGGFVYPRWGGGAVLLASIALLGSALGTLAVSRRAHRRDIAAGRDQHHRSNTAGITPPSSPEPWDVIRKPAGTT